MKLATMDSGVKLVAGQKICLEKSVAQMVSLDWHPHGMKGGQPE
jgi:hypothetical protein